MIMIARIAILLLLFGAVSASASDHTPDGGGVAVGLCDWWSLGADARPGNAETPARNPAGRADWPDGDDWPHEGRVVVFFTRAGHERGVGWRG